MPRSSRSWCDTADSLMPDELGDVADAELARRERVEDADARRIAEDAEGVGQRFDRARRHQRLPADRRVAYIEMRRGAGFAGREGGRRCRPEWRSFEAIGIPEYMSKCSYVG